MPTKAVIIIPSEGKDTVSFLAVATKLKKQVYGGNATIVQTKLLPTSADGLFGVSFSTLDGHAFSWDTAQGISSVVTVSHGFSGDGPNLAYQDSRFDLVTHQNQPWGSDPDGDGSMGQQGKDFWTAVGKALTADGKVVLVGCFMGAGYAGKVAQVTGKRTYGSTSLFAAGDPKTVLRHVQAIEQGAELSPMTHTP